MSGLSFSRVAFRVLVFSALWGWGAAALAVTPYGECRVGFWSGNRDFSPTGGQVVGRCLINARGALARSTGFTLNVQTGWQDRASQGPGLTSRLREGFVSHRQGPWSFALGRQIIAWGRADRINPTDVLSPRDFTTLTAQEANDRLGIDALRADYDLDWSRRITVVATLFEPHRTPSGQLPVNLQAQGAHNKPELALKYDSTGESVDFSVSLFQGYNRFRRYTLNTDNPVLPLFQSHHERQQTLGLDFSMARDLWTFRAEAAYSDYRADCAPCGSRDRAEWRLIGGFERLLPRDYNLNFQVFLIDRDYVLPPGTPALTRRLALAVDRLNIEYGEREHGFALRLGGSWFNQRLKGEFSWIADLAQDSSLMRSRLVYELSDSMRLSMGQDHFDGTEQSLFGSQAANNISFLEWGIVF